MLSLFFYPQPYPLWPQTLQSSSVLLSNIVVYIWIGHFLPEEDDKFLEKVRAAVEEEERQAKAAADTAAAKDAIATAEVSRKTIQSQRLERGDLHANTGLDKINQDQVTEDKDKSGPAPVNELEKGESKGLRSASLHGSVANLPMEFYHYYYGSNHDLGTLIEVNFAICLVNSTPTVNLHVFIILIWRPILFVSICWCMSCFCKKKCQSSLCLTH